MVVGRLSNTTLEIQVVVMTNTSAFLATTVVLLALVSGCAINPATGDEELMLFSADQDVKIGNKYGPEFERALGGRYPDENLQNYVNDIGQRIARFCHRPDIAYHFCVARERQINAFAIPGGYVFITRGLLEELDSEAQLAAILAHEISHVVARDSMVALSRQIGMMALVAAAAAADSRGQAVAGTSFVGSMLSLQYSRNDEKDADLIGLGYMVQAGYDPNGVVEAMKVLQELQTIRPIEFFSTHPNPESRITYLEDRIEQRYGSLSLLKTGREEYEQSVLSVLKADKRREPVL